MDCVVLSSRHYSLNNFKCRRCNGTGSVILRHLFNLQSALELLTVNAARLMQQYKHLTTVATFEVGHILVSDVLTLIIFNITRAYTLSYELKPSLIVVVFTCIKGVEPGMTDSVH